jgi:hypothetical protein
MLGTPDTYRKSLINTDTRNQIKYFFRDTMFVFFPSNTSIHIKIGYVRVKVVSEKLEFINWFFITETSSQKWENNTKFSSLL